MMEIMYKIPIKIILNIDDKVYNISRIAKKIDATHLAVQKAVTKIIKAKLIERFRKYKNKKLIKRSKLIRLTKKGLKLKKLLQIIE